MIYIEKDKLYTEEFSVLDEDNESVAGLTAEDFDINLYNDSEENVANITGGIEVSIIEVEAGIYRVSFIPDAFGNWSLYIYSELYFSTGKGESFECIEKVGEVSGGLILN